MVLEPDKKPDPSQRPAPAAVAGTTPLKTLSVSITISDLSQPQECPRIIRELPILHTETGEPFVSALIRDPSRDLEFLTITYLRPDGSASGSLDLIVTETPGIPALAEASSTSELLPLLMEKLKNPHQHHEVILRLVELVVNKQLCLLLPSRTARAENLPLRLASFFDRCALSLSIIPYEGPVPEGKTAALFFSPEGQELSRFLVPSRLSAYRLAELYTQLFKEEPSVMFLEPQRSLTE